MARDDRKIVHAVRAAPPRDEATGRAVGSSTVYKEGQEDELAEAVDKATLQRLFDEGAITGEAWGLKATPETEPKPSAKKAGKK